MKSFKAEFKAVYEKGLMQYGFRKVKGPNLYFARCIGNEIVHLITFREEISSLNQKGFSVLFGVATVYRKKIAFDVSPRFCSDWLSNISTICYTENFCSKFDLKARNEMIPHWFEWDKLYEETMMEAIGKSFELTEKYAIPILDKITTLEDCVRHLFRYHPILLWIKASDDYIKSLWCEEHNEGLLSIRVFGKDRFKEYEEILLKLSKEESDDELYSINAGLCGLTMEQYRKDVIEREEWDQKILNTFQIMANDPEWQEKINMELELRKNNNTELLRKYGLDI